MLKIQLAIIEINKCFKINVTFYSKISFTVFTVFTVFLIK